MNVSQLDQVAMALVTGPAGNGLDPGPDPDGLVNLWEVDE
jgi:hypothetical protein